MLNDTAVHISLLTLILKYIRTNENLTEKVFEIVDDKMNVIIYIYIRLGWSIIYLVEEGKNIYIILKINEYNHLFTYIKKIILVKFGHDYSPSSRVLGMLKNSQTG